MTGEDSEEEEVKVQQFATSISVNTDWTHLGDYLKEPTTGRHDESGVDRPESYERTTFRKV